MRMAVTGLLKSLTPRTISKKCKGGWGRLLAVVLVLGFLMMGMGMMVNCSTILRVIVGTIRPEQAIDGVTTRSTAR